MVKSAKRLQDAQRQGSYPQEDVNDVVDEMILKAFKIVNKGVRFVDVLDEDRRARAPAAVTVMATVMEESYIPPTPPSDRTRFEEQRAECASEADSRATTDDTGASVATSDLNEAAQAQWNRRVSSLNASSMPNVQRTSQSGQPQSTHRHSASMSHRVSLVGPSPLSRPSHLISERLGRNHDKFLSHLGSFIGRLHWQSPSRLELSIAIKQSATSGGQLLAVVDGVCANCTATPASLYSVRAAVFERIQTLVLAARDTLIHAATEDADMIFPQDSSILLNSATACVKAAGECVAKAKQTIERIGDFEFALDGVDALGIDLSILDVAPETRSRTPSATGPSEAISMAESAQTCESHATSFASSTKGTHEVPRLRIPSNDNHQQQASSAASSRASSSTDDASSQPASLAANRPLLPPLPKLTTTLLPSEKRNSIDSAVKEQEPPSARVDALATSAGSTTTYLSRDSETSMLSQSSTRATTPEQGVAPKNMPSISELSTAETTKSIPEDADDFEYRLLEKTYAHELMFNKEGQVTGGSLPALVERLTTHESTPDATFVSTFFLTFRLFCTPVKLTKTLIDRFDYVYDSPHMAQPVRLRVYNAFKGWLESHWRDQTDRDALKLIMPFAEGKLTSVLPSAGRRLLELAMRVSGQGSLVPRLVSSIGKTNTAIGQYVPAETPVPSPVLSKHQNQLLSSFKAGSASPTVLDFDPLELARQLTIRQMSIFCSIVPEELLGSQWMKKGGADAPNVKAMSSLSTDLSNLVAETILQYPEVKKRATVIKHWIKIAQHCFDLHNYDGLMAIICSLNSSTITRLRKTWDAISDKRKETLRILQKTVEPAQNNKVLRTKLHDHIPPCLPFLGMYLTDLTFVDIGNPATKQMSMGSTSSEDGSGGLTVVNFDKHTRTAKIIGELQRFQIPYRLSELPDMQLWMTSQIQRVRESDQGNVQVSYYRKSLLLEPRESRRDEPPTPVSSGGGGSTRGDLFGWMTRDRHGHSATVTQG